MNVAVFRSDIKVAAKQNRTCVLVVGIKIRAQSLHPVEFELILFRTHHLPIGDINVDDFYSRESRRQEPRMRRFFHSRKTTLFRFAFTAGQDSYAVIGLLPKSYAAVAALSQHIDGKFVVCALGLLQAKYIRL